MPKNFMKKQLIERDKPVKNLEKQVPAQDSELCFINLAKT